MTISQVSLPSQNGAIVAIIASRSALSLGGAGQNADAEVEAVQDHIDHDRNDDHADPEQRQVRGRGRDHRAPPGALATAIGPLSVTGAALAVSPEGPSRSSR